MQPFSAKWMGSPYCHGSLNDDPSRSLLAMIKTNLLDIPNPVNFTAGE